MQAIDRSWLGIPVVTFSLFLLSQTNHGIGSSWNASNLLSVYLSRNNEHSCQIQENFEPNKNIKFGNHFSHEFWAELLKLKPLKS
jgi:hypothetical protein